MNKIETTLYPVVFTIILGIPVVIGGSVAFAIISNGDGVFNTKEAVVLGSTIGILFILGIVDVIRWERWQKHRGAK